MPRLSKERLLTAVKEQIAQAEGYQGDELSAMRDHALDYYYQRPNAAPNAPGRSSIQSSDVADMVEAVNAQVMPAFELDNIVEFEPLSEEDIEQANSETQAVNYVVMQQNNGYYHIQQAVKDALLVRNGVMKIFLDETIDVTTETYEMLTELEYGELMMQDAGDLSNVDNGIAVTGTEDEDNPGFWSATVKQKTTEREVKVCSIDPVNFSWFESWDSIYLEDCPFVAERSLPTRSDLLQMGFSKSLVMSLPVGATQYQLDARARDEGSTLNTYQGETPSQDLIETYECYIRIDMDGDNVNELMKVVTAGNKILEAIEVDFVPYASGTPFLQPHRFNGLGLYDKLQTIQDAKTATLRQLLDNQNHANNSRVGAVEGMVNMDDLTNSRPGGVVRLASPDAMVPFPFTDIGPSAQNTLDYMDKVRSERGGASLDMLTAEAQIAGDTAHGVERQMTAKEQLAAQMTRTLADTLIRTTYAMVHKALRLWVPDDIQFRSGGQFVNVNPSQWQERRRITVKAGLSMAERQRKKIQMEQIIQRQDALIAGGFDGTMVNAQNVYSAQQDWCRASGVDSPERYFVDPASPESQQAAQEKQQQAEQARADQQQLVELQRMVEERKADNDDAKVMEDARQADQELQFKYYELSQEMEVKEAELVTDTALKVIDNEQKSESAGTAGEPLATGTGR